MTIAFVNTVSAANWTATPGTTLSTPAFAATQGNLLVATHNGLDQGTIFDTAGNMFIPVTMRNGNYSSTFWYAKNIIGNVSNVVTINFSPLTFAYLNILQYSGCDQNAPFDTGAFIPFNSMPTVQNPFSPAISTRFPNEVLIGWIQSSDAAATQGSGWTARANPGAAPELIEDMIVTTVQNNVQATATESTLAAWFCAILAFIGAGQLNTNVFTRASNTGMKGQGVFSTFG